MKYCPFLSNVSPERREEGGREREREEGKHGRRKRGMEGRRGEGGKWRYLARWKLRLGHPGLWVIWESLVVRDDLPGFRPS